MTLKENQVSGWCQSARVVWQVDQGQLGRTRKGFALGDVAGLEAPHKEVCKRG